MSLEFSAYSAISALRAQIEDRLAQNEDYQSLKALDKALADIRAKVPAVMLASVLRATEPALVLPETGTAQTPTPQTQNLEPSAERTYSGLMQRLNGSFPCTTVSATVAKPLIQIRDSAA